MLGAAVLIVVLMPVHAFFSTWLGTAIGPLLVWKSWKEIVLLLLVPVAVMYCWLRPDIAHALWKRPINKLIALYVLLHGLLAFSSIASVQAVAAALLMNLRFLAIFVLVQIIAQANPPIVQRLKQLTGPWLLWVAIVLGVLAVLQVAVLPQDFLTHFGYNKDTTIAPYTLVDQNVNAVRAFATLRGPNTYGAYLLLPLCVALYRLYKRRDDVLAWAALGLCGIGMSLTGSRSAWLGAVVAVVTLAALLIPRLHLARWVKRGIIIPAIVVVAVVGWLSLNVAAVRLAIFHSSPGDSSLFEGSSQKHAEAVVNGIHDIVRHPLGQGPGSAGPASFYNADGVNISENYFVQIAQETGIIGLVLFMTINILGVMSILRHKNDLLPVALVASFAGLTVINLFLHGWADDPTALTWWALAGLYMGSKNN